MTSRCAVTFFVVPLMAQLTRLDAVVLNFLKRLMIGERYLYCVASTFYDRSYAGLGDPVGVVEGVLSTSPLKAKILIIAATHAMHRPLRVANTCRY